jgi:hypothetical protein
MSLSFSGQAFLDDLPQALSATLAAAAAAGLDTPSAWRAWNGGLEQGPLQTGADGLAAAASTASGLDVFFGEHLAFIDQPEQAKIATHRWCELRLCLKTESGHVASFERGRRFAEHLLRHGALGAATLDREPHEGARPPRPSPTGRC